MLYLKEEKLQSLVDLNKGERAKIVGFTTEDIPAKFYEMGIMPGVEVEYKHSAPFDGPVCIFLSKECCKLALRKVEAKCILVNKKL